MQFSKRFLNGLKLYKLCIADLEKDWRYFGGDKKKDLALFKILKDKDEELPEFQSKCICGHKIKTNSYITDGERILILGTNCARKFLGLNKPKNCLECGLYHRNSKDNRCTDCRNKVIHKTGNYLIKFN